MTTPKTVSGKPFISVIIPVRNDTEALGCTLEYLSDLPGMKIAEIIVAASGDRHGTERAAIGRAQLLWPSGSTRAPLMNPGDQCPG
jgi:hypothetical protein